jgi:hypothetical protein
MRASIQAPDDGTLQAVISRRQYRRFQTPRAAFRQPYGPGSTITVRSFRTAYITAYEFLFAKRSSLLCRVM